MLASEMSYKVSVVHLERLPNCWETTSANKLPVPGKAVVKWSNGAEYCVDLGFLASDQGRDVFAAEKASYVLKPTIEACHERSNLSEAHLAQTPFKGFVPQVYGLVLPTLGEKRVSVLVAAIASKGGLNPSLCWQDLPFPSDPALQASCAPPAFL